jgi:hypothetical protein
LRRRPDQQLPVDQRGLVHATPVLNPPGESGDSMLIETMLPH